MHVSMLALMGLAISSDLSLPKDVIEVQNRRFVIPLQVDPRRQKEIECVRLFVSEDQGKTWQCHVECKLCEKIIFEARSDGQYWFAIQSVAKDGRLAPAKVADFQPDWIRKVYVNCYRRPMQHDKTHVELSDESNQPNAAVRSLCSPPTEPESKLVLASFDIPKHGDLLVVPVTTGNETYKFGVDTGASRTVFDTSLRKHMGEPGEKLTGHSSLDKTLEVETRYPPDAKLGELHLDPSCDMDSGMQLFGLIDIQVQHRVPVPLMDFSALRKLIGYDVRGIIGMDFLRQHVVRIDFETGKLWFLKAAMDRTEPCEKIAWDKNGLPTVEVQVVDRAPAPFLIDTGHGGGAMAGTVERRLFQGLVQSKMISDVEDGQPANDFTGNKTTTQSGALRSVEVGTFKHDDLLFTTGDRSILGLGYWSRYVVTFDFPNSVIYLTPVPHYRTRVQRHCSSGVSFVGAGGSIVVDTVKQGTAAAKAGVKAGDIVLAIENQSMKGASVFEAYEAIESAGDRLSLTIKRGKEPPKLTLLYGSQKGETNNSAR
jgi:hypothetical protein